MNQLATWVLGIALSFSFFANAESRSMQITDANGVGVAGAKVFLLQPNNKPISPIPVETDHNGFFNLPSNSTAEVSLTVDAQNFVKTSFLNVGADVRQLQIHVADPRSFIEIKGETTGFGTLQKDGYVDFALVYPALGRRDLLNFDVGAIISSEMDTIKIAMQEVQMPSNLTLPVQQENYIIPVTFKKPEYRMFVRRPGTYKMMATHGQFPLQKVMSDMKGGKSLFDVINHFRFIQTGERELQVDSNVTGQNLGVAQTWFTGETSVTAPQLSGQERMVSAALIYKDGYFFPSDVKNVASTATQSLKVPAGATALAVSLLTLEPPKPTPTPENPFSVFTEPLFSLAEQTEGQALSLALHPGGNGIAPEFVSLVQSPRIEGEKLILNRPTRRAGIEAVATFVTLAEIEYVGVAPRRTEKRYRMWELFQNGWATELQVPEHNFTFAPNKNYRWEVMFLGRDKQMVESEEYFLDNVTHVSRNSRNF